MSARFSHKCDECATYQDHEGRRRLMLVPTTETFLTSVVTNKVPSVSLATSSCSHQLPSAVLNLTANPRGSRALSDEPDSPPTVEKRMVMGHFVPFLKRFASDRSSRLSVHSHSPWAPDPLAWTTRSGIRSRSKCARRLGVRLGLNKNTHSMRWKSCRRRPWLPARWEA